MTDKAHVLDINENLSEETQKLIRSFLLAHPGMTDKVVALVGLAWGDGVKAGADSVLKRIESVITAKQQERA